MGTGLAIYGGATRIPVLLGAVPQLSLLQRELKQNTLPASSILQSLHLITGVKQGHHRETMLG